ncbi:hypothetical protein [Bacillus sp. Marseille-Q3570]|uniref:hypothetical protein n=1 Tax=Bacillus sp. Marseille-Q3570 TaxID=2963522 RepID=UPI0021B71697|nr:hypothetical protein [Bacillus sp. Marseille-Q3570]
MVQKLIVFIVIINILSGCGTADADQIPTDSPVTVIEVKAENWKFNKDIYKVFADQPITINFKSVEGKHVFAIKGMESIKIKGKGSIKETFEPGEYQIYCPIANKKGHTEMVATLIAVEEE